MTFETELRQVQKLEPGDVYLWKEDGATVTREVLRVERCGHGTAIVRVRSGYGFEADAHIGGRVEVILPVALRAVV